MTPEMQQKLDASRQALLTMMSGMSNPLVAMVKDGVHLTASFQVNAGLQQCTCDECVGQGKAPPVTDVFVFIAVGKHYADFLHHANKALMQSPAFAAVKDKADKAIGAKPKTLLEKVSDLFRGGPKNPSRN